jgi:bifunctional DNA-binding transcriptional regulator/antitoxin component of YhaV-PrlF toxin-antitoxin module
MTATLTIDPSGSISLPQLFLQKFHLKPGARLLVDVSDNGMELRPDDDNESREAKLVDRDGFLVFTGTTPFDAVEVIQAARADRDEQLLAPKTP